MTQLLLEVVGVSKHPAANPGKAVTSAGSGSITQWRSGPAVVSRLVYGRVVSAGNTSAWVTAAFGLGGAAIGATAVLGSQYLQWRREVNDRKDAAREKAVEEVIVRALSVALVAHQMAVMAHEFSSLNGTFGRLLRIIKKFDYQLMFDNLNREAEALNRASAQIWMSADQETVKLTNAVTLAATSVVEAHSGLPKMNLFGRILSIWRGIRLGDEQAVRVAQKRLADARRALVDHTRSSLELDAVDLFALPAGWEADVEPGDSLM